MKIDLDGQLVDAREARVSPFDGAYQYGDGLFDTLRCYRGFPFQLEEHVRRLEREAELLQLPFEADTAHWASRIEALLEANDLGDGDARIRIQLSRGGGPEDDLVSADPASLRPVTMVVAREVGEEVATRQIEGVRALSLQSSFARGNFPQIKSLNYLPSIMAARFARAQGYDEALLLNAQSKVLEGSSSNVFVVVGEQLRTPPVRLGLLPGITRERVLALATDFGLTIEESALELRELLIADEVFLTGSVKEIVPLVGIDRSQVGSGRAGDVTRTLQEAYQAAVEDARRRASAAS